MTTPTKPEPMTDEQSQWAVSQIMEQAQVFASACSLVGGRFDMGNALEEAEQAKQKLHSMLNMWAERLRAQPAGQAGGEPVHAISGKTADELWMDTGALRAQIADLKVELRNARCSA